MSVSLDDILTTLSDEIERILIGQGLQTSNDLNRDRLQVAQLYNNVGMLSREDAQRLNEMLLSQTVVASQIMESSFEDIVEALKQTIFKPTLKLNRDRLQLGQMYFDNGMMSVEEFNKLHNLIKDRDERISNDVISNLTNLPPDLSKLISGYNDFFDGNLVKVIPNENFDFPGVVNEDVIIFKVYRSSILKIYSSQTGDFIGDLELKIETGQIYDFVLVPREEIDNNAPVVLGFGLDAKYILVTASVSKFQNEELYVWTSLEAPKRTYLPKYGVGLAVLDHNRVVYDNQYSLIIFDIKTLKEVSSVSYFEEYRGSNEQDDYEITVIPLPDKTVAFANYFGGKIKILDPVSNNVRTIYYDGLNEAPLKVYSETEIVYQAYRDITIVNLVTGESKNFKFDIIIKNLAVFPNGSIAIKDKDNNIHIYKFVDGKFELAFTLDYQFKDEELYKETNNRFSIGMMAGDADRTLKVVGQNKLIFISPAKYTFIFE